MSKYKTLVKRATGEYREKGSRFISYGDYILNENEARSFIAEIAREHPKAKHLCYAYSVGVKTPLLKYSDAHEPANTAGIPILNQIKKYELTNVGIIVVRYFGGVLLGKGGLIRAYSTVAENAIINSGIIEKKENGIVTLESDYEDFPLLMDALKNMNLTSPKAKFGETWQISSIYDLDDKDKLLTLLAGFPHVKVHFQD